MSYRKLSMSVSTAESRARVAGSLERGRWKPARAHLMATQMVADAVGVPYSWVLLTNSCTAALAAAYACGPQMHHTVPLMTFAATAAPALLQQVPVEYVDVNDAGWPVSDTSVSVDLWGRRGGPYPQILDAAHRFAGAEHRDYAEKGTIICYSFGPQKEVATPQGGAMVWKELANEAIRVEVEAFLHYGQSERVPTGRGGLCGYMPETTAALLCPHVAASKRRAYTAARQRVLETYENFLGELLLTKPGEASGHLAVIRLPDNGTVKTVQTRFRSTHIEYGLHYPVSREHKDTNAYALAKRILSLPCHTRMTPKDAAKIARIVLTA